MISRENRLTVVFVVVALPTAYLTERLLESAGIGDQTAYSISFFVLLGVGVFLPQFLIRHR